MSLIQSTYNPTFLFKNSHLNTTYKTFFNKSKINYKRNRIKTPDNDFLDLDFSTVGSKTMVVAMHGLEGSSQSKYIISVINYLNSCNIDCLALNFRGCSGEDNTNVYSYNSGKTDDVGFTIKYLLENFDYENIILLGYSMGGNITLKYMGETVEMDPLVKGAIGISVPCDLKGSSEALGKWYNTLYLTKFLNTLKEKSFLKLEKFPNSNLDRNAIQNAKDFEDFDNAVTAPLFGFKNAEDYWRKCSSKQFIPTIKRPTLLVNALDDSFLSKSCYPIKEAKKHSYFRLEMPEYGGHVGFNTSYFGTDLLWSEKRVFSFIKQIIR